MHQSRLVKSSETETFKQMIAHVQQAIEFRQLATIVGDPGTGKSHLAGQFAESHPGCILMTIDVPEMKSWPEFVRRLSVACNGYQYELRHLSTHHIFNRLRQDFVDQYDKRAAPSEYKPWLLIDEAQRLSFPVLRAAIDLQDVRGGPQMPVVLLANKQFLGHRQDRGFAINQISSRTDPRTLNIEVTWRDYQQVAIDNDVQGSGAYAFLQARYECKPELRDLTALLSTARSIVSEGPLALEMLELAQSQMGNFGPGNSKGAFKFSRRNTAA